MKFSIMQPRIKSVLKKVVDVDRGRHSLIYISADVGVGLVTVTGWSEAYEIVVSIETSDAEIQESGTIAIYGKVLLDYIVTMHDMRLDFVAEEKIQEEGKDYISPSRLIITCGRYEPSFNLERVDDLRLLDKRPEDEDFVCNLSAPVFETAIDRVLFSAGREHRPALCGVRMTLDTRCFQAETADGIRLSRFWYGYAEMEPSIRLISTLDFAKYCRKVLGDYEKISMYAKVYNDRVMSQGIVAECGVDKIYILGSVVNEDWIDTDAVIEKATENPLYVYTVDVPDMKSALESVVPFTEEPGKVVEVSLPEKDGNIGLSASGQKGDSYAGVLAWNVGVAKYAHVRGENQYQMVDQANIKPRRVAYNCQCMLDFINCVDGKELTMLVPRSSNRSSATVFLVNGEKFLHLLMPLELRAEDDGE